jgi:hypothetical protein
MRFRRRARSRGAPDSARRVASCLGLAIIGVATPVAAAPARSARLTYGRGAGAADCPEVDVIRAGVAARLGYEPFDDHADLLVSATVSRSGRTLEARIQIGGAGVAAAERRLVSRQSDCLELASAMELAISIAIDPLAGSRPRPSPAAPPAGPPPAPPAPPATVVVREPPPPATPAPAPRSAPPSAPLAFQVRLGGLGAIGSGPAAALGGTVQGSVRRGPFSVGLEGRGDLSSTASLRAGEMQTSLLMGSLVPCAFRGVLEGCALLAAGVIRASGLDLVDARQVSAPFVAAGGRVGVEVPLGSVLTGGIHLDVLAPITQLVLRVSGEPVWTSPPITGALGLTLGARFL